MPALISAILMGPQPPTASILDCFCLDCLCFSTKWMGCFCPGLKEDSFLHLSCWEIFRVLYSSCRRTGFLPSPPPFIPLSAHPLRLSPLDVVLRTSTFPELHPSWVFLLQLFNTQMEVSLSSVCPILLPRHNHVYVRGKVCPTITNALQKTDGKPNAERERKTSMNFRELLVFPCVSISSLPTIPSHNRRTLGCDGGSEALTEHTFGPGYPCLDI